MASLGLLSARIVHVPRVLNIACARWCCACQAYTFTVAAENKLGGSSTASASSNTVVAGAPDPPPTVETVAYNHSVQVLWTVPSANAAAIQSYTVTTSPPHSAPVTVAVVPGAFNQSVVVSGLTNLVG